MITDDLLLYLTKISRELGRQVGILVDRKGRVTHVILGDDHQIEIPEIRARRVGSKRLTGLRCIHTHVKRENITRDDLNDLLLLRLDLMATVEVLPDGAPGKITLAHVNVQSDEPYLVNGPAPLEEIQKLFEGLIPQIESDLERQSSLVSVDKKQTAMLIHVSDLPQDSMDSSLNELEELARTAYIHVVDRVTQRRENPDPRYLMGKGKLQEFMIKALSHGINMVIFDTELSPLQLKAISDFTDIEVMDRTQLILTIFERRAHSSDGMVRVNLAKMRYLLPRLGAKESALSRIRGGIGLRGPGETTAEIQRRHLKSRIEKLEKELETLKLRRNVKRKAKIRSRVKTVSIIGYTNSGKSTLLNRLTGSRLFVEDLLFATLDPAARSVRLPGGLKAVISDTVGLIRNMPQSVEGVFRATFEELVESHLLIHLVDISNPDFENHIKTTDKTLQDIGLHKLPLLTVFNKVDLVNGEDCRGICRRFDALPVSAKNGAGIKELLERMGKVLENGENI